jgi:hypothetical protein
MQNKVGIDYRKLPGEVDPRHRNQANIVVAGLDQLIAKISSFGPQPATPQEWHDLATNAYKAMSLIQFYPSRETKEREIGMSGRIDKLLQFYAKAIQDPTTPQDTLDKVKQELYKAKGDNALSTKQLQQFASIEQRSAAYDRGEPLMFGGVQMDPNDPTDAAILAQLRQQGKI